MMFGTPTKAFPTPCAHDAIGHSPSELRRKTPNLSAAAAFPTPRVNSLCGGSGAWDAIHNNPALTADEKRAMTSTHGQLNPDWVEWLMGWPVGWTDPKCDRPWPFLHLHADPADLPPTMPGYVPRVTMRRANRAARIRALGNGQVPQCASESFKRGLALLSI